MVCNRHALMGLCAPTSSLMPKARLLRWRNETWKLPPRCNVAFTLRVLRSFDIVGFTDRMDDVWSRLRAWAEQHIPAADGVRATYLRRLGRVHSGTQRVNASRGVSDYLRVARALLAKTEQATSELMQEATARRANASSSRGAADSISPTQKLHTMLSDQEFRRRVHKHLDGATEASQRVALLEHFPSRAEFERRNDCALRVWSEARRLFLAAE